MSEGRTGRDIVNTILSFLATPWLLLLSTSIPLFLKNQGDLYYRHEVLYPFLGAALLIYIIAVGLYFLLRNSRHAGHLFWGYYLLAPLFLVSASLIDGSTILWAQIGGSVFLLGLFIWLVRVLNRKFTIGQVAPFFALLAGIFISVDMYSFVTKQQQYKQAYVKGNASGEAVAAAAKESQQPRHNIYHIIFDEYQTEMFSMTLTPEVKQNLGGFVFFSEAITPFGRTEMSFGTIFSGKQYDFTTPPLEYQNCTCQQR